MQATDKPVIRYEDAAEPRTVDGWACKTCRRFFAAAQSPQAEHIARWCCATDLPCECGGRNTEKNYVKCQACRDRQDAERWAERYTKAVEWDGEAPLYSLACDLFFWDAEEIVQHIEDRDDETANELTVANIAALRLVLCTPDKGRDFNIEDFLSDSLPEDADLPGASEINKVVNDWIQALAPLSWHGDGRAVTVESVCEALSIKPEAQRS